MKLILRDYVSLKHSRLCNITTPHPNLSVFKKNDEGIYNWLCYIKTMQMGLKILFGIH